MLTNTKYKIIDAEKGSVVDTFCSFEDIKEHLNVSAGDVANAILDGAIVNDSFYIEMLNFNDASKVTNFVSENEREEIINAIDEELEKYPIKVLAERIGINEHTFYKSIKPNRKMNKKIAEKIVAYLNSGNDKRFLTEKERDRLIELINKEIEEKSMSRLMFANKIGVNVQTLYNFLGKKFKTRKKSVEKIINYFKTEDNNA